MADEPNTAGPITDAGPAEVESASVESAVTKSAVAESAVAESAAAGDLNDALPQHSSASRRVRARLARRMTATRSPVRPVLEPLVTLHREIYPKADVALLQRAYDVADERHQGQNRKSGDPYITHPLAVATILADLGMDTITLVAALLHDTVEDTAATLEEIERMFGPEIGKLVDGVTKLTKIEQLTDDERAAEAVRKFFLAMSEDIR
ncbi:MAG TPA: GTP pyrophosphokinase, partial [Gordonia polyisoprenivorans]|nr:GTP pyrophosphokinase [Gordonia polyisoprenivorans]